jgi:TRAP-type C4-dicarboxylate transport system permease small subunit
MSRTRNRVIVVVITLFVLLVIAVVAFSWFNRPVISGLSPEAQRYLNPSSDAFPLASAFFRIPLPFGFVLAVLTLLMPIFVYQIKGHTRETTTELKRLNTNLERLLAQRQDT